MSFEYTRSYRSKVPLKSDTGSKCRIAQGYDDEPLPESPRAPLQKPWIISKIHYFT